MPKALLIAMAALFAAGCTSPPKNPESDPASLPDARDLAEHPLDVLEIPQL